MVNLMHAIIQSVISFLLVLCLPLQLICPMHPIQKSNRAIIQIELLMMQIMHACLAREEIIPAMHCRRVHQLVAHVQPKCQDVAAQDLRRQCDWQDICKELLDWVRVLRRDSNGGSEAMVLLVDVFVKHGKGVEEAVDIVEEDFAEDERESNISGDD